MHLERLGRCNNQVKNHICRASIHVQVFVPQYIFLPGWAPGITIVADKNEDSARTGRSVRLLKKEGESDLPGLLRSSSTTKDLYTRSKEVPATKHFEWEIPKTL